MNKIITRFKKFHELIVCGEPVPQAFDNATTVNYKGRRIFIKGYFKAPEVVESSPSDDYNSLASHHHY